MRPSLSKTNIERGTQATKEPVAQCCGARRPDVARHPPSDGKLSVSYQGWDQSKTVLPSRRSATCFRAATIFLKVDQTIDWYVTRARDGPWCRKSVFSVLAAPPRRAWFEAAAAINFIPHTGGFGPVVRFVSINARPDCGAGVEVPAGTSTPHPHEAPCPSPIVRPESARRGVGQGVGQNDLGVRSSGPNKDSGET